jgi:hypothetical protein
MAMGNMASFRVGARFCVSLVLGVIVAPGATGQDDQSVARLVVMIQGKIGDAPSVGAGIVVGIGNDRLYIATANHVVRQGPREAESV